MTPTFFRSPAEFRRWLQSHHADAEEFLVGFYKRESGKGGITYPEALDQALCFGWIDGVRRSVDDVSYTIRFTPRKPKSNWSAVNIRRVGELTKLGLMKPPGLDAFERRDRTAPAPYSFENKHRKLDPAAVKQLKANQKAWAFFSSQAPWYQRTASWWVISAKKEETRAKRLLTLIQDSAAGRRIGAIPSSSKKATKGS